MQTFTNLWIYQIFSVLRSIPHTFSYKIGPSKIWRHLSKNDTYLLLLQYVSASSQWEKISQQWALWNISLFDMNFGNYFLVKIHTDTVLPKFCPLSLLHTKYIIHYASKTRHPPTNPHQCEYIWQPSTNRKLNELRLK